ncbi:MAG: Crp/Fnr family transcriptional regulator [Taibaiella sp.]|jgi:CRP-like cAMP-binding protein
MKAFIEYILQFGNLNQQQIDFISKKANELELSRNEYYWEAGKAVKQIGFISEGVLRVYYYTNKGEENTRYFVDENHLILDGNTSAANYTPSEYLQAITDCKLIIFSKKDWKEISDTIVGWDSIIQKIITKYHAEKLERRSPLVSQDATTRYLEFMEAFPMLVNRIPLSFIASYLGVTQQSLSRIRKKIH